MKEFKELKPSVKKALEKAANFCAYQERCMQDVRQKLTTFDILPDDAEEVISLLIKNKFLNEERFSRTYCRSKFTHNKWGKIKITQHLKQKEISDRNIKLGLSEINETDYKIVIQTLIEKKKESLRDKNQWVRRKKITDYMVQKGFEYDFIQLYV